MPKPSPNLVVVLCEDAAHKLFIERWLKCRGVSNRRIRTVALPAGKGAGEKFVRDRYPVEVLAYRQSRFTSRQLIVAIDADTQSVDYRLEQLAQSLKDRGMEDRQPSERICILVPKRNIETWVRVLIGDAVTEEVDCGKQEPEDTRRAADVYQAWLDGAKEAIPSLTRSRTEVRRLDGD